MRRRLVAAMVLLSWVLTAGVARADVVEEIKARGKLLVGIDAGGLSAILQKGDDGKWVGHDADINAFIAKELGVELEMIDTAWDGIIPALYAKRFDMILCGMTPSKARAERVAFSVPYADSSIMLVTRADDDRIHSPKDMSGMIMAAQLATPKAQFLRKQELKLTAAGLPGFKEIKEYPAMPEMFLDLANHRVDGIFAAYPTLSGFMKTRPGVFKVGTTFDEKTYFAAALRKEDKDLMEVVNRVIMRLKRDGTLEKLQVKWFGVATGPIPDEWTPPE